MKKTYCILALMVFLALAASPAIAQDTSMSFFVTSVAPGNGGGDLGGLHGADMHCQALAAAAGAGSKTWHAYLSQTNPALHINARDRIGTGPWYNARGTMIARDIEDLHSDSASITEMTALTESGAVVPPEGNDVLTGSRIDGTAWPYALMDQLNFDGHTLTCQNWTSEAIEDLGTLGHINRRGNAGYAPWNATHPSRGCDAQSIADSGGAGLLYCFATD
jgi:hypothetical protein